MSRLHQYWKYDALVLPVKFTGVPLLTLISVYPFGETIRSRLESHFRQLALLRGRILGVDRGARQVGTSGCSSRISSSLKFRASYTAQKCTVRGLFLCSDFIVQGSSCAATFPSTGEELIGARNRKWTRGQSTALRYTTHQIVCAASERRCGHGLPARVNLLAADLGCCPSRCRHVG
ncbi:hypothetical protein BJY52DRAFT_885126 [Lactarius psammicola]|nr:hypothetical protein BJY52DRAFT_885126 [Lactarius psammicola]